MFYPLELSVDGGCLIEMFFLVIQSWLVVGGGGWGEWYVYHGEGQIQPSQMYLFLSKLTKGNEKLGTIISGEPVSES